MWKYYALISAFFAAATALLVKGGVRDVDSNLALAIRTGVVLLLTWSIVLAGGIGGKWKALSGMNWLFLILSGLATGLSWLFYFKAMQEGPVAKVAALDKLSVAMTLLMAWIIFREPLTVQSAAGVALITAGAVLLLF